jgi:hypothetical protein
MRFSRFVLPILALFFSFRASGQSICVSCINIRVGRPLLDRGPVSDELDNPFNEIQLSNGDRRGFSANASTYAIEGPDPWSMGWPRTLVLSHGPQGSYDFCGRWMNSTDNVGSWVNGFIHAETDCNYSAGQTHKSMAFAVSGDQGLSWVVEGQIITGMDSPTQGKVTGEGDCTVVNGQDGYYYAYCLRNSDYNTIVARAPVSNPYPGSWTKYYNGSWSQPGLGGNATPLGSLGTSFGMSTGYWTDTNNVVVYGVDASAGGLIISFSPDKTSFTTLAVPVIPLDGDNWNRPQPTELIAYPSLMNYGNVNNQISSPYLLAYVYLQPNETFSQRYLVFRDIYMWLSPSPVTPQVGIALARWYNASVKDRWSTTAPVPGDFSTYVYEGTFGYLMTAPDPTQPTTKLEDCVSYWPGHPDHLFTYDGWCVSAGYTRLRTAGWVYQNSLPNTVPLYRCYSSTLNNHFASNRSDCEGLGTMEYLLGYALAN